MLQIKPYIYLIAGLVLIASPLLSQETPEVFVSDSSLLKRLEEVVITTSKTELSEEELAMPLVVMDQKQISLSSVTHLNELLQEQSGMIISESAGRGSGIQIQGFDPEYTMVLIDGEPMLGRSAGVLDLSRISLRNVERIEILKGASSCLYGSNAMAGAINIITKKPSLNSELGVSSRYRSPGFFENGFNFAGGRGQHGLSVYYNNIKNLGYQLYPETDIAFTQPPSNEHHFQLRWYSEINGWKIKPRLRLAYIEHPEAEIENGPEPFKQSGIERDLAFGVKVDKRINEKLSESISLYRNQYLSHQNIEQPNYGSPLNSVFNEVMNRGEILQNYRLNDKSQLVSGLGFLHEELSSTEASVAPNRLNLFVFNQFVFTSKRVNFQAGIRYDYHKNFGDQFSPSLSAKYKISDKINVNFSSGAGYKVAALRQQYFDFTNPAVGYTVLGAEVAKERINELEQQGLIRSYVNSNFNDELQAESSWSNSLTLKFSEKNVFVSLGAFYNIINNYISTLPVAVMQNNQLIYSYANIDNFNTQGFEAQFKYDFGKGFKLQASGQLLWTEDDREKELIENGEVFVRDPETFATSRITASEYLGLFGRSRANYNVSLNKNFEKQQLAVAVRYTWRSAYSLSDTNGNLVYDIYDTQSGDYHLVNVSAKKSLKNWSFLFSVNNIFDYRDRAYLPAIPGRFFGAAVNYTFNFKNKK